MNPIVNVSSIISETPEAVAERAAADFAAYVTDTLKTSKRFTVALPGGATPKLFFNRLREEPYRHTIPWKQVWLFWGDERCVGPEHPDSNFRMARENLLQEIGVPSSQVFRMRGEDPPALAARSYETTLHEIFGASVEWPVFDLIILGLGPDGHTASLMPGTSAIHEEKRWVAENVVRSLQTVRITLTFPVLNHARQVWFLVTGAKKAAPLARAQAEPSPECPASLVRPESGKLLWYMDRAAAAQVADKNSVTKQ